MEDKSLDNFSYEDSEDWKGSSKQISIKEISLKRFSKAMEEGSKEMVSSGVDKKLINGQVYEFPRPNQREVFVNSVDMARIPLEPEIEGSKVKTKFAEINIKIKGIDTEFLQRKEKIEKEFESERSKTSNRDQYRDREHKTHMIDIYNKKLSELTEQYEFMKVGVYKEMLTAISFLLKELDYFNEAGFIG